MIVGEGPAEHVTSFEEELLQLLARQGSRVPIPVFLAAALIAALAASRLPVWTWASWLLLVALWLVVRWAVLRRLPAMTGLSARRRLSIAVVLSGVNGAIHALSLGFFPYLPELERAILSMVLLGLCAGSVATTAGYMPVFLAYLLTSLVPLCALWAISPGIANPGWVEHSTATLIVLLGAILIALGHDAFRLFRESFDIRMQHAALNIQLESALEQAEAANHAKTRFLAAASHDLRQPIHALSLFAGALSNMVPLDASARKIAEHINEAVLALASEFDALLDLSKLDAGLILANRTTVSVSAILERKYGEFEPIAQAKGLKMVLDFTEDMWIETDLMLLDRVLRNLLENAIKYTDVGRVSIAAFEQAGVCVITVSDSGRGISDHEQTRIFEEFYQIDNPEHDRARGFGLGLAIVKRLVDLLEIRMEMVSVPKQGTRFSLSLPTRPAGPSVPREVYVSPSVAQALQVLVVDDEASIRLAMKVLLETMGCQCMVANGTEEAVAAARAHRPDIAFVDLRLRGEDSGIATVRALRNLYPDVIAILISGDTAPGQLQEAEASGIAMLHKPVAPKALEKVLAGFGMAKTIATPLPVPRGVNKDLSSK
jgi:signal transduction histidine kinase/CheY-like chemotaxis protein